MDRYTGLIGIALIFGIAFAMSNNRKAINYRVVLSGLGVQLLLALFILKTAIGKTGDELNSPIAVMDAASINDTSISLYNDITLELQIPRSKIVISRC